MFGRAPASPRRRFATSASIAAIALFAVLAGTGASYAYWSASANSAATVNAGTVNVAVAGFTTTLLANHIPSTTGSVTVTNQTVQNTASTTPASVEVIFSRSGGASPGSAAFAAAATVQVWTTTSAANCTAAATVPTGTWPTGASSGTWAGLTVNSTIAKGSAQIYCVRTTLSNPVAAGVSSGANDFLARISATASVGNLTGTANVVSSQTTAYIYPLGTTSTTANQAIFVGGSTTALCVDVESAATTSGAEIIPWGCHGGTNQNWRFTATATGYYDIYPVNAAGLRMGATGTASGSAVTAQTDNGATAQDWQLQTSATGTFQFVNRASGLCLTSSSTTADSNSPMTVAPCNGTASQRFQPASNLVVPLTNFDCSVAGGGLSRNLTLSWASVLGNFTLWIDGAATDTTAGGTTNGMSRTINVGGYPAGSHGYTVVNSVGQQVASGTFTMGEIFGVVLLSGCTP